MLQAVYRIFVRNFIMFCNSIFSLGVFWHCILGRLLLMCANWSNQQKHSWQKNQVARMHTWHWAYGSWDPKKRWMFRQPGPAFGFPACFNTFEPHCNEVESGMKIPSLYLIFIISMLVSNRLKNDCSQVSVKETHVGWLLWASSKSPVHFWPVDILPCRYKTWEQ